MSTVRPILPLGSEQPPDDTLAGPDYAEVSREVRRAPPRYRNEIGKFSIRRASNCLACGRCVETCEHAVHVRPQGYRSLISTNIRALLGKARVATAFRSFTCTGEGGYPERFVP